ncbi:hypothetical protein ACU686_13445 [Yinghuangia aomiensis]
MTREHAIHNPNGGDPIVLGHICDGECDPGAPAFRTRAAGGNCQGLGPDDYNICNGGLGGGCKTTRMQCQQDAYEQATFAAFLAQHPDWQPSQMGDPCMKNAVGGDGCGTVRINDKFATTALLVLGAVVVVVAGNEIITVCTIYLMACMEGAAEVSGVGGVAGLTAKTGPGFAARVANKFSNSMAWRPKSPNDDLVPFSPNAFVRDLEGVEHDNIDPETGEWLFDKDKLFSGKSDQVLLDSVFKPNTFDKYAQPITIYVPYNQLVDGNHRAAELLARAMNPGSSTITMNTPIYIQFNE